MLLRPFEVWDIEKCAKLIKETSEEFNRSDFTLWNENEFFDFFDSQKNKENLIKFFEESDVFVATNQKNEIIWVLKYIIDMFIYINFFPWNLWNFAYHNN